MQATKTDFIQFHLSYELVEIAHSQLSEKALDLLKGFISRLFQTHASRQDFLNIFIIIKMSRCFNREEYLLQVIKEQCQKEIETHKADAHKGLFLYELGRLDEMVGIHDLFKKHNYIQDCYRLVEQLGPNVIDKSVVTNLIPPFLEGFILYSLTHLKEEFHQIPGLPEASKRFLNQKDKFYKANKSIEMKIQNHFKGFENIRANVTNNNALDLRYNK